MSYAKQTWDTNSYVNPTRMNHIEDGIDNALPKDSGGTVNGNVTVDKANGTSSAVGYSEFIVGNNVPQGTAGNSQGIIRLYSNTGNRISLLADNISTNRAIYFPNKGGTVSLDLDNAYYYNNTSNVTHIFTVPNTGCYAIVTVKHSGGGNLWHGIWLDSELIEIKSAGTAISVSLTDRKTLNISATLQYYQIGIIASQQLTHTTS